MFTMQRSCLGGQKRFALRSHLWHGEYMIDDGELKEAHDDEPATKGFVREAINELADAVKVGFDKTATKDDIQQVNAEISLALEEVKRYFDIVTENIHQDVAGANKDELSLIQDQKIPELEQRVEALERGG